MVMMESRSYKYGGEFTLSPLARWCYLKEEIAMKEPTFFKCHASGEVEI